MVCKRLCQRQGVGGCHRNGLACILWGTLLGIRGSRSEQEHYEGEKFIERWDSTECYELFCIHTKERKYKCFNPCFTVMLLLKLELFVLKKSECG